VLIGTLAGRVVVLEQVLGSSVQVFGRAGARLPLYASRQSPIGTSRTGREFSFQIEYSYNSRRSAPPMRKRVERGWERGIASIAASNCRGFTASLCRYSPVTAIRLLPSGPRGRPTAFGRWTSTRSVNCSSRK